MTGNRRSDTFQYQAILESQTAPEKMRPGLPYSSSYPYGIDVEKEIAQAIAQAEGREEGTAADVCLLVSEK